MQRKTLLKHYLFQSLAGVRMIPKSGRVLEGNPITMEYNRYCIITMTSKTRQGKRPRNIRTLWSNQVSKIKIQTRAVACSSSLRRA